MDLRGWTTHWKRYDWTGTGKDRKELRWRCIGVLSEGSEVQSGGTEKLSHVMQWHRISKNSDGYEWSGMAVEKL